MKKLFMSLVAVTMLTTAAFAGGEKTPAKKATVTTTSTSLPVTNGKMMAIEKVTTSGKQICHYSLTVVGANGQVLHTFTSSWNTDWGLSCAEWVKRKRAFFKEELGMGYNYNF